MSVYVVVMRILCYAQPLERKYVRVSGEATIRHVELFIRRKMELAQSCQVQESPLCLS